MGRDADTRLVYSTDGRHRAGAEPAAAAAGTAAGGERIRIRLERRASGRLATVVTGLSGGRAQLDALARELKAACGAGGTFKNDALELQGDHREAVERALAARGLRSKRAGG